MDQTKKIVRRKLSDEVFDRLTKMIAESTYAPGDRLPSERDLMELFGVGRPAVREAMQSLEKMGMISINHGERARVASPTVFGVISQIDQAAHHLLTVSPQSLESLREARIFFEVGMVRLAAEKAKPDDVRRLREALEQQRAQYGEDTKKFVRADMNFHTTIASIFGNPVLEAVSKAMLGWLASFQPGFLHWIGKEHHTLEEHEGILEQIEAGNVDEAADAMIDHLRRARLRYPVRSEEKPPAKQDEPQHEE
jgi:DNA-binding FadR family transcriptional regulator